MFTTYIPTRSDLVEKQTIDFKQPILFIPVTVENSSDYRSGSYVLKLIGSLINGWKTNVVIKNIKVFFDILIENESIDEVLETLRSGDVLFKHEIISKYPIKGYNETKKKFIRIYTNSEQGRKILIDITKTKYETYSDDETSFYRKVAREYDLHLTKYNVLNNYYYHHKNNTFYVDIFGIEFFEDDTSNLDEKIMIMTWDIETYSNRPGELPRPQYDGDKVWMIGIECFWKNSIDPIAQICISTQPLPKSSNKHNWTTLICKDQTELLMNFANVIKRIDPDIEIGFNISGYDWPFVIGKLEKLNLLQQFMKVITNRDSSVEDIRKYHIRESEIKISATEFIKAKYLKLPGILSIDTMICYKKIYPNSEKSSLNYFLNLVNLEGKLDLTPSELSSIYSASNEFNESGEINEELSNFHQNQILKVAEYCMIDAKRCQELLLRHNVIDNYQRISDIARLSLMDSYLTANGIKVRNLIGAYAHKNDILISMRNESKTETGKYPGAFVFPPEKGLNNTRPVTGLDFASLYPSLIMTYNLSPEKIILSNDDYKKHSSIKNLHPISFKFNNKQITAWSIRHDNVQENKGIYAILLEDLLNQRKELKRSLSILERKIEEMETNKNNTNEEEYKKVLFQHSCVNSQQLALKVYMNSFYGETGNQLSPFFLRELAGGVTSAGQYNIKLVAEFVKERNFEIVYGDTDSLYLIPPNETFSELDQQYQQGVITKLDYWTLMVNKTIETMTILKNTVNEFLISDNGTKYLKMAYEEVLYPVCFTGKKKYFGVAHRSIPNFFPTKLFIRGLEIIKRGQSQFAKDVINQILWEAMNINNTKSMKQIVEYTIKYYVTTVNRNTDVSKFILTATYKPSAKNQSVQSFVKRMQQKRIVVNPGERFEYVVINNNQKKSNKSDRMELLETYRNNNNMTIDIVYYLNSIVSICARLINYCVEFQPTSNLTPENNIDEESQKKAAKYVEHRIKYYQNQHQNLEKYGNLNVVIKSNRKRPYFMYKQSNQSTLDNFVSKKHRCNDETL